MKAVAASLRSLRLFSVLLLAASAPVEDACTSSPCGVNAECYLDQKGNGLCSCKHGHSGDPLTKCFPAPVFCTPLTLSSRDIECRKDGKKVDCNQRMTPGTKANIRCNTQYTQARELSTYETECKRNGQWSRPLTPCEPTCGKLNAEGLPFITNGVMSKKGQFPWHAGIYQNVSGEMVQICGGSIVSPHAIVTAAHCFWDDSTNTRNDLRKYKIIVGKHFRDWNKRSQPDYVQVHEINDVAIHERYKGTVRHYAHDIAVVVLNTEIRMTEAVRPICVDYDKEFNNLFIPGLFGIAVGWGNTENNTQSEVLRAATLPHIGFKDCERSVPDSFQPLLTADKFCAGYRNGTSVCRGDSGGGFAANFSENRWYLVGIVSVGVPLDTSMCDMYQYAAFTKVSEYYDFIKNFSYESYSSHGEPCNPSPCGQNAQCHEHKGKAQCSCLPGYAASSSSKCDRVKVQVPKSTWPENNPQMQPLVSTQQTPTGPPCNDVLCYVWQKSKLLKVPRDMVTSFHNWIG